MQVIDDLLLRSAKDPCDPDSKEQEAQSTPVVLIEDRASFYSQLRELKATVAKLDADQRSFLQKERDETVYGSEKAPIGDSAYLSLFDQPASFR